MKRFLFSTVFVVCGFVLRSFAQATSNELAVPWATNLQHGATTNVNFPFTAEGKMDKGKWEYRKSKLKGDLQLTYKQASYTDGSVQFMRKIVPIALNGYWKMEGLELYPPENAYDIEYLFFVYHELDGKISLARAYSIVPNNQVLKKYGIIKLAQKPAIIAKPLPYSEMRKRFEKVKLNPQPIPPKTIKNDVP